MATATDGSTTIVAATVSALAIALGVAVSPKPRTQRLGGG
jgi:hypothetical protein